VTDRVALGVVLAGVISLLALRARALTTGGGAVATIVGTLAVAAGWSWGALLIAYFVSSTLLSRIGRAQKETRTASIIAKTGGRDALQVLANGALFAAAAAAAIAHPDIRWIALGAGSLAASAADTWATEVGTLAGGEPRSIITWRRVPAGTSGAVSGIGTVAMLAGALFLAVLVLLFGWTVQVAACVAAGGIAGAVLDSVLGATAQVRRWCEACARETERTTHDCGATTRRARGLEWMDNDIVNFLSNTVGGLLAALLLR
jgi:uncharacterized protein (TIGR00297 family)